MDAIKNTLHIDTSGCYGYSLLRVAIVEQAVRDYKDALNGIVPAYAGTEGPACTVTALELFFLSEWGEWLCGRSMVEPLKVIREQVAEERKRQREAKANK